MKTFKIKLKVFYDSGYQAVIKFNSQSQSRDEAADQVSAVVAKWSDVSSVECLDVFETTKYRPGRKQAGKSKKMNR